MTIQEISSLLFLANASVVNRFAAAWGSLIDFTRSTASWFFITCIQKGNTEYIKLVYEHTFQRNISNIDESPKSSS